MPLPSGPEGRHVRGRSCVGVLRACRTAGLLAGVLGRFRLFVHRCATTWARVLVMGTVSVFVWKAAVGPEGPPRGQGQEEAPPGGSFLGRPTGKHPKARCFFGRP